MTTGFLNKRKSSVLARLGMGALAGFIATLPMTLLMGFLSRLLPRREQYPLPPWLVTRKILLEAAEKTESEDQVNEPQVTAATAFTHFGYGAASGAVYSLATGRWQDQPVLKGLLFGLGLWSLSYLGWLPALGILPPATRQPAGRNALMIVANMFWGLITALLLGRVLRKE